MLQDAADSREERAMTDATYDDVATIGMDLGKRSSERLAVVRRGF